jgi:hypothetical protein
VGAPGTVAARTRDPARPYDHAVDAVTARQVLRVSPDSPLTPELVERAFAGESAARHPSLSPDAAARAQAEEWGRTLQQARSALLADLHAAPATQTPRRRRSGWAIAGIAVGVVALLSLVTFGTIVAVQLVGQAADAASRALESGIADAEANAAEPGAADPGVDRMDSDDTLFAFPAAVEFYADGRYLDECPLEYEQGCWQTALFTEADCEALQVQFGFTNDANAVAPDVTEIVEKHDVVAGEPTIVVFGHDDYGYGWISQVTCLASVG